MVICCSTDVSLQLCLNHTLWTFRRDVACDKMLITGSERDTCLGILRDMAYSNDEAMYSRNMDRLEAVGSSQVLDYVRSYWHDIRSQWVDGLKEQHLTFGESTIQRLESVSAKMKNVCCEIASLQQFFMEFRAFLVSMRAERTHRAMMMLTKKPTSAIPEDLLSYRDCLTPHAFRMVQQQYTESLTLGTCSEVDEDVDTFVFASTTGTDTTRLGCCSCRTYTSTRLPCKHLLYVRRLRGVEFDDSVFDSRWKCADYVSHCQLNLSNGATTDDMELLDTKSDDDEASSRGTGKPKAESRSVEQAEKYRKARHMTDQLASLCAKPAGMTVFASRLQLLQRLYDSWSKGAEVTLVKLETADGTPSHKRKRGRPPKLDGKTPTKQSVQKRRRLVGRPKGSTKQKYHQSADTDDDNDETCDALIDGDVEATDEPTDVDAMLLAMAADDGDAYLPAPLDVNDDDVPDTDLDASASVEANESQDVDISDCIIPGEDGCSYVIVPENSGLLADVVGSRLELRPLDVVADIRMQSPRKRGRPPKQPH